MLNEREKRLYAIVLWAAFSDIGNLIPLFMLRGVCSLPSTFVLITHLYGLIMNVLRIRKGRKVEEFGFEHIRIVKI